MSDGTYSGVHILQQVLCLQGAIGHLGLEAGEGEAGGWWEVFMSPQPEDVSYQTVFSPLCTG